MCLLFIYVRATTLSEWCNTSAHTYYTILYVYTRRIWTRRKPYIFKSPCTLITPSRDYANLKIFQLFAFEFLHCRSLRCKSYYRFIETCTFGSLPPLHSPPPQFSLYRAFTFFDDYMSHWTIAKIRRVIYRHSTDRLIDSLLLSIGHCGAYDIFYLFFSIEIPELRNEINRYVIYTQVVVCFIWIWEKKPRELKRGRNKVKLVIAYERLS